MAETTCATREARPAQHNRVPWCTIPYCYSTRAHPDVTDCSAVQYGSSKQHEGRSKLPGNKFNGATKFHASNRLACIATNHSRIMVQGLECHTHMGQARDLNQQGREVTSAVKGGWVSRSQQLKGGKRRDGLGCHINKQGGQVSG